MEQQAFEDLKAAFVNAPILVMPDMNAPFRVETDASDFAMGAILLQQDVAGEWRPVAYYSKVLQPAERNYDVHDKELLSVVWALEAWRPYLEGNPHKVEVFSDHKNLEFCMTARDLNGRQAHWSIYLNRFNFVIHRRPGRLSSGPDGLSRHPDHEIPVGAHDNADQHLLTLERLGDDGGKSMCGKRAVVVDVGRCGESEVMAKVTQAILSDGEILEWIRVMSKGDPKLDLMWDP